MNARERERDRIESALHRLAQTPTPTAHDRSEALVEVGKWFAMHATSRSDVTTMFVCAQAFYASYIELAQQGSLSASSWYRLVDVRVVLNEFVHALVDQPAPDDVVAAVAQAREARGWA